jgi:hypothetical protein
MHYPEGACSGNEIFGAFVYNIIINAAINRL